MSPMIEMTLTTFVLNVILPIRITASLGGISILKRSDETILLNYLCLVY